MKNLLFVFAGFLVFTSCSKIEIERIDDVTVLDYSQASDQLGELTYAGFIVRNQADFDTLMAYSGDTMTYPGLQANEVLLICSQKVEMGNGYWVDFYSSKEKDSEKKYEFNFMTESRPDVINGDWTTQAIIVPLENVNAEIAFKGGYRGN